MVPWTSLLHLVNVDASNSSTPVTSGIKESSIDVKALSLLLVRFSKQAHQNKSVVLLTTYASDDEQEDGLVPDCYQDPEAYKITFKDAYVQRGDKLVFVGESWKVLKAAMPTVLKAWNKNRIEYCESKMTSENQEGCRLM